MNDEPPRIKKFRSELVQVIPRFPNDRASLRHMQGKSLLDLLIDYVSWRSRYVGRRPRTVTIEPGLLADPRWTAHASAIASFLEKVRLGEDLTPHLSLAPHTKGYAPAARAANAPPAERWSDKDFVLNAMGYHHFHLGTATTKRGHVERTDDLIFARVARDSFDVIAVFGHDVFEHESAERLRLWSTHDEIAFRNVPPGSVVVSNLNTLSGHTLQAGHHARECAKLIRRLEPLLDGPISAAGLYGPDDRVPPNPKFSWSFYHLDFFVDETSEPSNFLLRKGWN